MKNKPLEHCSGCKDPHSEGTHCFGTIEHPSPIPPPAKWGEWWHEHLPQYEGTALQGHMYDLFQSLLQENSTKERQEIGLEFKKWYYGDAKRWEAVDQAIERICGVKV